MALAGFDLLDTLPSAKTTSSASMPQLAANCSASCFFTSHAAFRATGVIEFVVTLPPAPGPAGYAVSPILLVMSVGTGSAPKVDAEVYSSGKTAFTNLANFPAALMYGAQVDQDINCRIVGRCVYGAPIDGELGDLIPRDAAGNVIPTGDDQGRSFLYARYNAELTSKWLNEHGLGDVDPSQVAQLDSVEHIKDLVRVGQAVANEMKIEHFSLDRFNQFY